MFQKIKTLMMILFAAVFQISAFPNLFPGGVLAEIILILVVFWTMQDGFDKTWPKAVAAGLIADLFYFWPVGINIIALCAVAYGTGFLTRRFSVSQKNLGFFVMLLLVMIGTLINSLILSLLLSGYVRSGLGEINTFVVNIWDKKIFLKILINLFMFVIIYWPLSVFEKFMSFYDKKSMQGRFFR